MWTPLGAEFNAILLPIIAGVAAALAAALAPLLLAALTLWLVTQAAGLMTGGSSASWPALLWRAAIIVAVGTLSTSIAFTTGPLFQAWDGVRGEIATAFATASGGVVNSGSPWAALDELGRVLETALMQIRAEAAKVSSLYEIPEYVTYLAAWVILGIAGGVLQLVGGWLIMLSSLLGAFAIGLAPLFIAAAAFQASRQYFVNWLTFLLSIATLSGVAMFCLAVAVRLSTWVFARAAVLSPNPVAAAADFLGIVLLLSVVQLLLATLVFQGPSIAGQMLGAAGVGQGGSLMQTMLLLSRAGRPATTKTPTPPPAGQIIGSSPAYSSGRSAGAASRYVFQQVASRMNARASTPRT